MFQRHLPPDEEILLELDALREAPFSYPFVGLTRERYPPRPRGFFEDRASARLGSGDECFDRAVAALRAWRLFELPWIHLVPARPILAPGMQMHVCARTFGLWSRNATRIVWVADDTAGDADTVRRFGLAYGTLPAHLEEGEESFVVRMRTNGDVEIEIVAFARPARLLVWAGLPIALAVANRFRRDACARLQAMLRDED